MDALPGRGGAPKRWVFETRKTLAMLTRAEKKTVSDRDRDSAITERAFDLASSGPFDRVVQADGGMRPTWEAQHRNALTCFHRQASTTSIRRGL